MKKLKAKTFRILLKGGPSVLHAYFQWMIRYSRHPERYPLEERYAAIRSLVIRLLGPFGVYWKGENEALLSSMPPSLIVGNHTSSLDPLFLILASPKPIKFIAKQEASTLPFAGRVLKALDCIFLDRKNPRQALEVFAKAQKEIKEGVCSYCIYPEGTRNKDPENSLPAEFHAGSLKIAFRAQCPVCLVSSYGQHLIFGGSSNNRSELLLFRVHPLYEFSSFSSSNTQELAAKLKADCSEDVKKFQKEEKEYFASGLCKKKPSPWWRDSSLPFPLEKKK